MAQITYSKQYSDAIQAIKQAILQSRYTAARLVNREMLALYYAVGEYISLNSRTNTWGTGALEFISQQLQQELPGPVLYLRTGKCQHLLRIEGV